MIKGKWCKIQDPFDVSSPKLKLKYRNRVPACGFTRAVTFYLINDSPDAYLLNESRLIFILNVKRKAQLSSTETRLLQARLSVKLIHLRNVDAKETHKNRVIQIANINDSIP